MIVTFTDKTSDDEFTKALDESQVVKNWLLNRILAYASLHTQVTLEIGVDPWSKTEKPSFVWAIYSQVCDNYGLVLAGTECEHIINGGLMYRGDDNYSSHT